MKNAMTESLNQMVNELALCPRTNRAGTLDFIRCNSRKRQVSELPIVELKVLGG